MRKRVAAALERLISGVVCEERAKRFHMQALLSRKDPDSRIHVKVEFGEGKGKAPLD